MSKRTTRRIAHSETKEKSMLDLYSTLNNKLYAFQSDLLSPLTFIYREAKDNELGGPGWVIEAVKVDERELGLVRMFTDGFWTGRLSQICENSGGK